ncbi:feruloyl esterase-like protein B precursor [Pyrenochaeta sp. MPI-SDFR-AT-0127]|nr:feruloyl esterase-like protein B precursor [Pyrenochaeta sp. MPI-SDFR-AT-0127]
MQLLTSLALANPLLAQEQCNPDTFQNLSLFGGEIQNIKTHSHVGLSVNVAVAQNHYAKNVTNLNVCEVIITYTHPGYGDTINTAVWLPSNENWTGRFLGAGGGGWTTGAEENATLVWAASEGFAVVTTDGGHAADTPVEDWALSSPGNVNWVLLQDFSSTALDDAATLGKAVVRAYYGRAHTYSYWNGCSTGGRQGHMLAQRYPDQYDGILATAAAINWNELLMSLFWPQAVMNELGKFPPQCELEAVHAAAVKACDALDGLEDGIVSLPGKCEFDPTTVVGQQYICASTNTSTTITELAATVAKKTFKGPTSPDNKFLWYGLDEGAVLHLTAGTECTYGTCVGSPMIISAGWIKNFLVKDPDFDLSTINITVFEDLLHQSINRYDSIIGTSDPDLSRFNKTGGKLLNWHGLTDALVPPGNTLDYVQRVYERDPEAGNYYRYFEAPGVDHCVGGSGWYPGNGLKSLIDWVEKGIAPETLEAETQGGAAGRKANLCLWPKRMVFAAGDPNEATSFECR